MAKSTGYIQFVCDRCGASTYAVEASPTAQSWKTIERYDASGSKVTRDLCPDCNKLYRNLAQDQDAEFSEFMNPEPSAV